MIRFDMESSSLHRFMPEKDDRCMLDVPKTFIPMSKFLPGFILKKTHQTPNMILKPDFSMCPVER